MVNCNPETVSTDYDTSDRLYFEPLDVEEVLAVLRARAAGGRRDPVRRPDAAEARARDRGRRLHRSSGTPYEAIDLAEDRERFGAARSPSSVSAARTWGIAERRRRGGRDRRARSATRCSSGPRYVLGGRAMRVCYDEATGARGDGRRSPARCSSTASSRTRSRSTSTRSATASRVYIGAVMEHVEEAGVHSGDSLLRAAGAVARRARRTRRSARIVRRLGPALGVVGLLNVQLALVDGEVSVLEANPRASRTVPFASKATGVNLVDAAVPARRRRAAARARRCRASGGPSR